MFRILIPIFIYFFNHFAIAYELENKSINIEKAISSKIKDYLLEEQIIDNLENRNIKIDINYQQQKAGDLEYSDIKEFELKDLNIKKHQFIGIIHLNDSLGSKINISGKFQILISLPVLRVKLPKNHIINEVDLEDKFFNFEVISSAYILDKQELIGMTLKKMTKAYAPIKKEFITSSIVINKNDLVSLQHNIGKVSLKVLVVALDSGSVGDFIRVKNDKTKQIMSAEIINNKEVKLNIGQ